MTQDFLSAELPCGLRVIYERTDSPVVYCGIVVCAGTRHEEAQDAGMAHFIEHMSFKGTARRRSFHISNALERVGGDLNAYTTKQETVYYATVLKEDFSRAADLLTDIVFHSTFPQQEIDKEVEVICDEIESYRDSPSELIFDEFEQMMYAGQPLGRDILGDAARLHEYTTADALRFTQRWYRPANCAFYIYGDVDFQRAVRTLEKLLPATDFADSIAEIPAFNAPKPCSEKQERRVDKGTHQAHVLMGAPAFGAQDSRHYALVLLNNLFGGPGMSSRLNVSLREKAGLVYSVDSYLNTYPDTGFWNVYFGCDAHDVERCRRRVLREMERLATTRLTEAQLTRAQKQLCGQIGISTDASESYALALGKTFAHYRRHRDVQKICEKLRAVTAAELQSVAEDVFRPERLTTLIYE